jgi:hypothetical protein
MTATHTVLTCVFIGTISGCAAIAQMEQGSDFMVPDEWGTITLRSMTKADLICAGKVVSSQRIEGAEPWWKSERTGADLQAYEATFRVDHVIRGPGSLAGSEIKVEFVGSSAGRPSLAGEVKGQRCLVCAAQKTPTTCRLAFADVGSFALAGPRPEAKAGTALTPTQRLELELVSALAGPDRTVRSLTLKYVGSLGLSGGELTKTLVAMRDGPERGLALPSMLALVRMGHRETLLAMEDLLKSWKAKGVDAGTLIGDALRQATKPEAVPLLIQMLSVKDKKVREGAAFALRFTPSPNTVAALAGLLDDPDVEIRFSAVNGLHRQTKIHREWFPGIDEFKKDPSTWTSKWKGWWEQEGKAKYPSVEQVLKQASDGQAR